MFPALIYEPFYLFLIFFLTMQVLQTYQLSALQNMQRKGIAQKRRAFVLMVFMIIFIGFRPISGVYFVDMAGYRDVYGAIQSGYLITNFENFIWDPLFFLSALNGIPLYLFFAFVALIYFSGLYIASKKIFPRDSLLAFLVYLAAFSTFSYGTNGIKAGAAASLFLVAIAYKEKLKIAIPFLFLSLGFHHSMVIPIVAFVAAYFFKNRKWYLYFWLICLLMAALHISVIMNILSGYTDEHGAEYLQAGTDDPTLNVSGFRPDFIMYSAVPIFLGNYLVNKYKIKSSFYDFIWNCYTLTNSVFLLCTYGTFINRIAYLSWLMYPFVLLYPFLVAVWSKRQVVYLKYTVMGHFVFTFIMFVVYLFR